MILFTGKAYSLYWLLFFIQAFFIRYSPRTYPFDSDIRETFLQIAAYLTEHSLKAT